MDAIQSNRIVRAVIPLLALVLAACGKSGAAGGPPEMPPAAVNVAEVVQKNVREWDDFTGRIEAVDTVEIRPRVSGYLDAVKFTEGTLVRKGDLLFVIDDREHQAQYQRALADVARAQTRVELANREIARAEKLLEARAISREEYDTRTAELAQAKSDVRAMEAAAASAKLNVEFTRITSPIDGRVGRAHVTAGNLVSANAPEATLLTTVVSVNPVYVYFDGDESVYLKYQQMNRDGTRPSSRLAANPVRMGLANEEGYPHEGVMDFVDNALDPSTGTIRGRAVFQNPDGFLTPGLFARLQLLGSGEHPAMLIHDRAVLTDQNRKYVYVLGPENKALRRDVKLGRRIDGLRAVEDGLEPGELVVVNGTQKIFFPGMPVAPHKVPMDQPELAPPAPPQGAQAAAPAAH